METPEIDLSKLRVQVNIDLKDKAKRALIKIVAANDIHLTTLWLESESFDEWEKYINDLVARLQ